ncbi:MAG: ribosome silencing factor [Verrucomicrobia bacterium]|nr:ribosome silencing factor [Verrucomicrobiota bacterium]
MTATEMAKVAREALEEKRGRDIVLLDVRGISTITDYVLIATGSSGPQLKAMAVSVAQALKRSGVQAHRAAGTPESGWVVSDYFDLVIHIFSPEARAYYAVEALWEQAPRLA